MALVTSRRILQHARENGYAVCAFNVENMEMIQAVVEAAEETASPVIIQTSANTVKYAHMDYYYAMVWAAMKHATTNGPLMAKRKIRGEGREAVERKAEVTRSAESD